MQENRDIKSNMISRIMTKTASVMRHLEIKYYDSKKLRYIICLLYTSDAADE